MCEQYYEYPISIRNEIKSRIDKESEDQKPKKKKNSLSQRLKLTIFLLINKAP